MVTSILQLGRDLGPLAIFNAFGASIPVNVLVVGRIGVPNGVEKLLIRRRHDFMNSSVYFQVLA